MPAYNFKSQFAEDVERGIKRQTIRPKRQRPTKPGDKLYLYTGMRTKQCRKLKEAKCLSVLPIRINADGSIILNGSELTVDECIKLSSRDGFSTWGAFFDFFDKQYGLPVELELIKW